MGKGMTCGRPPRAVQARALPVLSPPPSLSASRFEVDGLELAVLEWPAKPRLGRASRLTPAEQGVVRLALTGLSNRAIARRRGCAPRTVANQLASAYARLGIGSRAELAAWAAREGLP
jgi:DNA-binding CsgD family transcriptional regulator